MNAKQALGRIYEAAIGYDPFSDDPEITSNEALLILQDWRVEARKQSPGFDPASRFDAAIWQLERMDLDAPEELEGPALECIASAIRSA